MAGPTDRRHRRHLRVAVLGHSAQLSGAELALLRLLPHVPDAEFVVVLSEAGPLVDALRDAAIAVEVLPMPGGTENVRKDAVRFGAEAARASLLTAAHVGRVARRLRALRPDLVHTNTLKAALYGGVASRMVGIPCLWQVHDRIDAEYLPGPAVALVRSSARFLPAHVVTNSTTSLDALHLPPGKGGVVPIPVDVDRLGTVAAERSGHGRPGHGRTDADRPLRVGMIGRIAPWKGQDIFLRAFARAFPNGTERAHIIGSPLFGEDAYQAELTELVERLGIATRVELRGFRPDIPREMEDLDIVVHASVIPEPFGQVVVEGMAAGLPVVAADAGGPAEVITNGTDGYLYPPGDVPALAALLQRLAASPAERAETGTRARAATERYRPQACGTAMRSAYDQATAGRARGITTDRTTASGPTIQPVGDAPSTPGG